MFFNAVALDECKNNLENIVVYEETKNILLSCGLGSSKEMWTVRQTSNVTKEYTITNFSDSVLYQPDLYETSPSGLVIRDATIKPIATAGLYTVYFPDGNKTALKVVVIRKLTIY